MSIRKGQTIVAGAGNTRRNIGEVYYSQSSLATDNSGALPLWTGEIVATAMYPSLTEWVTKHTELQCTAEEYESALTTYGECPKYVISAESLRLPKLANYIKMANGIDGVTQKEAGLPNITGSVSGIRAGAWEAKGALTAKHTSTTSQTMTNHLNQQDLTVELDASLSSTAYGKSDTVTPAHTTLFPWVVAYTSAIEASVAQAAEFQQALSGKADANLGNIPTNIDYVVESYNDGTNWYRKYKSGWLEQGGFFTCNDGAQTSITFLKPFANTNYIWTQGQMTTNFGSTQFFNGWGLASYTETGMVVRNATNGTDKVAWYVCGQGA